MTHFILSIPMIQNTGKDFHRGQSVPHVTNNEIKIKNVINLRREEK